MRLKQFLPQVLYWVLFIGLFTAVYASYDGRWIGTLLLNLIRLPFMLGIAYFAFHRNVGLRKLPNWIKFILTLLLMVTSAFISRFIFGRVVFPTFFRGDYSFEFLNFTALFNQAFVMTAGVAGYGTMVYLREKSVWSKRREELIHEKKEAELSFYRAQVHPHFLFNTLNGIYAESLRSEGNAPDLILKLSELLRFMLYECNRRTIALKTELQVVENYIALEKLRYGDRLDVRLEIEPELNVQTTIPPLIFLGLVENAFKHGVSAQPDESSVLIRIKSVDTELICLVENTDFAEQKDPTGYQRGIGLRNIRRQLELIYEDRFILSQRRENGMFITQLQIPIL